MSSLDRIFPPFMKTSGAKNLILIGNGLGMALDPKYFSLSQAMNWVWKTKNQAVTPTDKRQIAACIGKTESEAPSKESELATLHGVVNACAFLRNVGPGSVEWLSDQAREFPGAVRSFIAHVALYFHEHDHSLPDVFIDRLTSYLKVHRSHVATLNYDNLLYAPLAERKILDGYNGYLIDGFWGTTGFDNDNLEAKANNCSLYLHLHGSPLFFDKGSQIFKLNQFNRNFVSDSRKNAELCGHIVLTHFDHKTDAINRSTVLSSYWSAFRTILSEAERLLIFGYSGSDIHINEAIASWHKQREVHIEIVEWSGDVSKGKREEYWRIKLGLSDKKALTLNQLDDILTYKW